MANFTLRLHVNERKALFKLAVNERRDPREQAALIIRRELERLGFLPPPDPTPMQPAETVPAEVRDECVPA